MQNEFYEALRIAYKEKNRLDIGRYSASLIQYFHRTKALKGKAFYHPLGFIYCRIHVFKNSETIRLHIWNKKRWHQKPLMDIHDHYYTVNSYVCRGCIRNNIYVKSEGSHNYAIYKGEYTSEGDRILRKTKDGIAARLSYFETFCEGDLYVITPEQLHSSYVEEDCFTCTLVYTESPNTPQPLVLGPEDGDIEYSYLNVVVEDSIIDDAIANLQSP